jgi:hypothetical protein
MTREFSNDEEAKAYLLAELKSIVSAEASANKELEDTVDGVHLPNISNQMLSVMADEPTPKRGDTLLFPSGARVKIDSVSEGLVWVTGHNPIPVDDLSSSGEPDTWLYKGDIPRA